MANHLSPTGLVAAADLSSHQFKAGKLNTTGKVAVVSAAADKGVGIIQNKPNAADQPVDLIMQGESRALLGGTVNEADELGFNTTGQLVATTTDNAWTIATALEAGVAGDIASVWVHGPKRY